MTHELEQLHGEARRGDEPNGPSAPDTRSVRGTSRGQILGGVPLSRRNQLVGWTSLAVGAAFGLVLGLWSFDGPLRVPAWLGDYDATSRRLARLSHIACFGLGILNILLTREMSRTRVGERTRQAALLAMNFGNVFLPLTLLAAALYRPLKYLMPFPAASVCLALAIAAYAVWSGTQGVGDADR